MAQPQIQYTYVDRPAVTEVFCEYLESFSFDGRLLRFEFCVHRVNEPIKKAGKQQLTGKRYTCARLVLTAEAGQDLYNKLDIVLRQLGAQQAGPPPGTKTN